MPMTPHRAGVPDRLARLADAVLMPCFDGLAAPEWVRRRVGGSLGGVCLFARNVGDVAQVAELATSLTRERESVVIAIDEEAGDVTRLDAATGSRFPGAAALGHVDDVAATECIARAVGELLAEAGVSLNLAPCADVALDPANPVIGSRSFGPDPALVARHTAAWVRGQQAAGVATCAKHFPGHGDTDADTHLELAVLRGELHTLRETALQPFAAAIGAGTAAIMPGHLLAPAVDDVPASLSRKWLTEILRRDMGFDGTIVTDALEMAAVARSFGIAGGAVRALAAGADVLCVGGVPRPPEEIDAIRDAIVDAVLDGTLGEERLTDAAHRARSVGVAEARAGALAGPAVSTHAPASDTALEIAVRAVDVAGPLPALTDPVLVVRCTDSPNIAVGVVPWGPATVLKPAATEIVLRQRDEVPADAVRAAGTVLVVTRDRHRHPWMREALADVRALRRDAVLVEMGTSGVDENQAPAIASFGASQANARAVAQILRSTRATA